jgi:hypothetical protein
VNILILRAPPWLLKAALGLQEALCCIVLLRCKAAAASTQILRWLFPH